VNSNVSGGAYALTVLTPIDPEREQALRDYLKGLAHETSPLSEFPGTHFGRWVILEEFTTATDQPRAEHLSCSYLLFTSCFDGALMPYLTAVAGQPAARFIWDHCVGYSAESANADLVPYLRHNQIDTGFFFAAYPRASLAQVRGSLRLRDHVTAFALRAQTMRPAELQEAFTAEFGHR
jgi:hypothetical protein